MQSGPAADYVQDVAGMAAAAAARRDGLVVRDEGPLGRTAAAQRLEGYATAVLSGVRGERHLGEVEDELFRFMRTVRGNDELNAVLTTAEVPAQVRQAVVHDLLSRRATPASVRLATYAAGIGRPRDLPPAARGAGPAGGQRSQPAGSRRPLGVEMTEAQRRRLAAALTRFAGYEVDVRVSPEPALLGGFVASVGDMVFDASLRRRLEQARGLLFAPSTSRRAMRPGAARTKIERIRYCMAELNINAAEIADVLRRNLENFTPGVTGEEVGRIREIGDGIARITGLPNVAVNELLELEGGVTALALNLDEDSIGAVILGETGALQEGQLARATGRILSVPVGDTLLGRVVDTLGPAPRRAWPSGPPRDTGDWRCRLPASSPASPSRSLSRPGSRPSTR